MNITIYALNNLLLYLIYLHKWFISVITIIAVQLGYSRGTACAAKTGYHVRVKQVTRVGQSKSGFDSNMSMSLYGQ